MAKGGPRLGGGRPSLRAIAGGGAARPARATAALMAPVGAPGLPAARLAALGERGRAFATALYAEFEVTTPGDLELLLLAASDLDAIDRAQQQIAAGCDVPAFERIVGRRAQSFRSCLAALRLET
jgi:hypothetical protein